MPQLLSNLPKVRTWTSGNSLFDARPEHTRLALQIILAGAESEVRMGQVAHSFSRAEAERLAKLFTSHENEAKKLAAFDAIATIFLSPDEHALLKRLIAKLGSALKLRNPFAHSRYSWTDDDDDLLLVINTRDDIMFAGRLVALGGPHPDLDFREYIYCYRAAELRSILATIQRANSLLSKFRSATFLHCTPESRAQQLAQLELDLAETE